jgi:very-short-patch-repair endonuclease
MGKFLLAVVVLGIVLAAVLVVIQRNRKSPQVNPPYFGRIPLTGPEQEMYRRLREAVPECIVLAQVALPALVGIKERDDWRRWFNAISQKSVDFVLCLPNDFTVVAVIELDDMSHTRPDRQRADVTKDIALRVAGHPILRFKRHDIPSAEELRRTIVGRSAN